MEAAYDLHIHSCLSPCASNDMTPHNIAGMAHLKGLSIISLTDHNAGCNLAPMAEAAAAHDLVFIPGVEATSREEVHVLIYFAELDDAVRFTDKLYDSLPDIPNRPDIFGDQIIMGRDDIPCGTLDKLLLQATPYSVNELVDMAKRSGGAAVPAHINRDSFSILSNLGFLPDGLFSCVEISQSHPCPPVDASCRRLYSSDAHDLGAISEPVHTLENITNSKQFINLLNS